MQIYLKAVCILSRRIYAKLRGPLEALLLFVAIEMTPFVEGWLLRLAFPAVLSPEAPYWTHVHPAVYWACIWSVAFLLDGALLMLWLLFSKWKPMWLDALREAKRHSCR